MTPQRALTSVLALVALLPGGAAGEPSPADRAIAAAERRVGGVGAIPGDYVALAAAFMQKARESGDPGYYARANAPVERALVLDSDDYGARRAAPWVLLGLHDFRGALAAAERARTLAPDDWWNYYVPVASALVISVAGLLIVANALSQTGLLGAGT